MTLDAWLEAAKQDAQRRGLPELLPLLDGLAASTRALRASDVHDEADGPTPTAVPPRQEGGR